MYDHTPLRITADVHLLRSLPEGGEPPLLYTSSLVLTGDEPIVVDLGPVSGREGWWRQVEAVVDPRRVRWVLLSHAGQANTANVGEVVARFPRSTVVAGWALGRGLADDGERLVLGGRELLLVRPPLAGPGATVDVHDRRTGVLWASTCFGAAVPHPVDEVGQIDLGVFERAFRDYHWSRFPAVAEADPVALVAAVRRLSALGVSAIASTHGPLVRRGQVDRVLELLAELPEWPPEDGGRPRLDSLGVRP